MQEWFVAWLGLPLVAIFGSLFAFYVATAVLLAWLSFRSRLSARILSFKGLTEVSLWTLAGRLRVPFVCGSYQQALLGRIKGQADLVYRGRQQKPAHRDSRLCDRRGRR